MSYKFLKHATLALIAIAFTANIFPSCKGKEDKRTPPTMTLKTGGIYTSADATVGMNDTITVGVTVTKTEDILKSFNVSYAFDGATTTTTSTNETLTSATEQNNGFSRDVQIITRNVAGTEKWTFTVSDLDGNLSSKSITLTVN